MFACWKLSRMENVTCGPILKFPRKLMGVGESKGVLLRGVLNSLQARASCHCLRDMMAPEDTTLWRKHVLAAGGLMHDATKLGLRRKTDRKSKRLKAESMSTYLSSSSSEVWKPLRLISHENSDSQQDVEQQPSCSLVKLWWKNKEGKSLFP